MKRSPIKRSAKRKPSRTKPTAVASFDDEVRATVLARSGYACEVRVDPECRRAGGDLARVGMSLQHRRPRQMGGSRLIELGHASNALVVCGSGTTGCHGWIESNREEARAKGWAIGSWGDPVVHVVTLHDGRVVTLTDEGGYDVVWEADGSVAR